MLKIASLFLLVMTALTGVFYCGALTLAAAVIVPDSSRGALVRRGDRIVGAENVGQSFSAPEYFWGRPSAGDYGTLPSTGSNAGPLHRAIGERVRARRDALRAADPAQSDPIPLDLVTASASGLDPDISLAAARWQISRVARARGLAVEVVKRLVEEHEEPRLLCFFGEPRINVLRLNLALEELSR